MYNAVAEDVGLLRRLHLVWYGACGRGLVVTGKRKRMDEESRKTHQELWKQYMEVERRELEQRRQGQLGRALGSALPSESPEELQRIAEEDQRKAERGLVELRSGNEVWFKHIDEITRDDRPARIESENARAAWIQDRLRRQPRPQ
jgi:hypothetical protein